MPPLDRMLLYVAVLNEARAGKSTSLPVAELIVGFGELTPDVVRKDFREMGYDLVAGSQIDLQAVYWSAVMWRDEAERRTMSTADVLLQLPGGAEIRATLPGRRDANVTAARSGLAGDDAARIADAAFDASMESPELFLLGHGRMLARYVAFRHQVTTAKRVLEEMHGVGIVADEVGLGKTIVAGLIIEELLAYEPAATVLILVPANLRKQWAEDELPAFFRRLVPWNLGKMTLAVAGSAPVVLLSLDQAKGNGKGDALATTLLQRKWDLLIMDEAHDCRNADSLRFRFVYSIRARSRLFLTATPVQNSGYDIFSLATLLKPGCLGPRSQFSEQYMEGERTLKDSRALHESLKPILTRTRRRESGIKFAERKCRSIKIANFKPEESELYDELLQLLRGIYRRHMGAGTEIIRPSARRETVSQFVLIAMLVLREMASHPRSAIQTLKTALWKRVNDFADLTRDRSDLDKLDDFIDRYTHRSWDVSTHAKSERLLQEAARLFAEGRKFIIYVNYLETHRILIELLAKQHPGVRILSYEGGLDRLEKDTAIYAFWKEPPPSCLVSTDAGGQGLNLQVADCVVNYDFPWNPMRVEQRIGRVDRARQHSPEITVLNFNTLGTVEEYVQIVLTSKLKEVRSVIGEFTSPLEIEKVYEDKLTMGIGSALMEASDAKDMRRRMKQLGEDDLRRYVGQYADYEKQAPPEWTWRPRD